MKKSYLKKIYKFSEEEKKFELELSLDYYKEMFNDWDAAPLRKKDLDPELVEYLEQASCDIPLKYAINILFIMPKEKKNTELETITSKVFKNYFAFSIHLNKRKMMKLFRKSFGYTVTGFLLLAAAYLIETGALLTFDLVSEGMFIGGWVFLWEAISLLFFKVKDIQAENKRYIRLNEATIKYIYK